MPCQSPNKTRRAFVIDQAWISADLLQHLQGVYRICVPPPSSTAVRFCRMLSDCVLLKTRSTRDRSIPRRLQRWVSRKSSISRLSFIYLFNIYVNPPLSVFGDFTSFYISKVQKWLHSHRCGHFFCEIKYCDTRISPLKTFTPGTDQLTVARAGSFRE